MSLKQLLVEFCRNLKHDAVLCNACTHVLSIGVARGAVGAGASSRADTNFFFGGGVIHMGKLYVHPQAEQEVDFLRKFLLDRERCEDAD